MIVAVEVDRKNFEDLMGSCNSGYWCQTMRQEGMVFIREIEAIGPDQPGPWTMLCEDRRLKGLQLMASRYPKHFADFLSDRWDGNTADVWLQLAVLGEVKYG